MKTITIYELMGLIKEDKAPKKIRAYGYFWVWNKEQEEYIQVQENKNSKMFSLFCDYLEGAILGSLNDEVKILEGDDKIKKVKQIISSKHVYNNINELAKDVKRLFETIDDVIINQNKLIDIINEMKRG